MVVDNPVTITGQCQAQGASDQLALGCQTNKGSALKVLFA